MSPEHNPPYAADNVLLCLPCGDKRAESMNEILVASSKLEAIGAFHAFWGGDPAACLSLAELTALNARLVRRDFDWSSTASKKPFAFKKRPEFIALAASVEHADGSHPPAACNVETIGMVQAWDEDAAFQILQLVCAQRGDRLVMVATAGQWALMLRALRTAQAGHWPATIVV